MVVAGALCVAFIVAVAVFAGSLAPQDPDEQNFDLVETRPGTQALFGTDRFGRFTLPGIGRLVLWSIYQRDYPLTQSTILFIAVLFMTINLLVDLLYSYLDPRIRYSR